MMAGVRSLLTLLMTGVEICWLHDRRSRNLLASGISGVEICWLQDGWSRNLSDLLIPRAEIWLASLMPGVEHGRPQDSKSKNLQASGLQEQKPVSLGKAGAEHCLSLGNRSRNLLALVGRNRNSKKQKRASICMIF